MTMDGGDDYTYEEKQIMQSEYAKMFNSGYIKELEYRLRLRRIGLSMVEIDIEIEKNRFKP